MHIPENNKAITKNGLEIEFEENNKFYLKIDIII